MTRERRKTAGVTPRPRFFSRTAIVWSSFSKARTTAGRPGQRMFFIEAKAMFRTRRMKKAIFQATRAKRRKKWPPRRTMAPVEIAGRPAAHGQKGQEDKRAEGQKIKNEGDDERGGGVFKRFFQAVVQNPDVGQRADPGGEKVVEGVPDQGDDHDVPQPIGTGRRRIR